ncbi:hypothetical protein RhiirA4_451773 [Rhizophagus irregularis]|uniref:Uncharacterized protein n=1 Tax=Rhizophagus irregularis TaxID=588596 RepID=A0A2I1FWH0_9GLOM|nr:hypothetical protein RhiirA4_451773 [Rhizophagus irregularis]
MTQLSTRRKDSSSTIENGNSFGRSIEFREGASIQLLKHNERSRNENFGQIVLNPEALNVLRTIHKPLAIISVESKQSDDKIIQKRVIVLDSEGFDEPKQDENWANEIIYFMAYRRILIEFNFPQNYAEFQKALKSFELAYEKSMMKSPKAARLEALTRGKELHMEIEAQKHENEENERNFRKKIAEIQANIEQHKSHEERKQRLIEGKNLRLKNIIRGVNNCTTKCLNNKDWLKKATTCQI